MEPCKVCGIAGFGDRSEKHYGCPGPIAPALAVMVGAVRKHAPKHYEEDGWDILVETYDYNELVEVIKTAGTVEEAIKLAGEAVGVVASVRSDVWGYGGLCTKCGAVESCEHRSLS